jgi:hypothetical protein
MQLAACFANGRRLSKTIRISLASLTNKAALHYLNNFPVRTTSKLSTTSVNLTKRR